MAALRNPPELDAKEDQDETPSTNELAYDDLCDLLTKGTVVCSLGPGEVGVPNVLDWIYVLVQAAFCHHPTYKIAYYP